MMWFKGFIPLLQSDCWMYSSAVCRVSIQGFSDLCSTSIRASIHPYSAMNLKGIDEGIEMDKESELEGNEVEL